MKTEDHLEGTFDPAAELKPTTTSSETTVANWFSNTSV